MARTVISARVFDDAVHSIAKEIVVKNAYAAISQQNKSDYIYVDRYESAARALLNKYSPSFLNTILDQLEQLNIQIKFYESELRKLEKGIPINNKPKPKIEDCIIYYRRRIEVAQEEVEKVITVNDTASESFRMYMRTLTSYQESNGYYRMLNGLPEDRFNDAAYVLVYDEDYGEPIPIHEQTYLKKTKWLSSAAGKSFIAENGNKPQYRYLNYLTNKRIHPYTARLAGKFELLYCPPTEPDILGEDFREIYNRSLNYIIRVFYSEAYRQVEAEMYEGFIGMAILFMTIGEMCYKYLDADISRDFYDLDSLKVIYEAYSVPFFDIIPIKFHKKIVKNINNLLAYKGSNQVFFDLCDIFDYDILGIYQYFLFKERMIDKNGDPLVAWQTTDGGEVRYDENGMPLNIPKNEHGNFVWTPSLNSIYRVYFVKANISDDQYTQLIDPNNAVPYDSIVSKDNYWMQFDPDTIKQIYEPEYNYIETKYVGVELMFQLTNLLWESSYFMGMLRDNRSKISNALFQISHDRLGKNIPLFDMLIYIIALICKKRGYDGEIRSLLYMVNEKGEYLDAEGNVTILKELRMPNPEAAPRILGFNFKGLFTGSNAIKDVYNEQISHKENTERGHHIDKDFAEGEPYHPMDLDVEFDFSRGETIQDWIKKNEGFFLSDAGRNLIARIFAQKGNSSPNAETAYFENLDIQNLSDISRAFKAMKNMKAEIDQLLYDTHDWREYNVLRDLQRLLYTTEIVEEVFEDETTGDLPLTYYDLLISLDPQLAARYDDEDIDIDDELDYCLVQLQNLCDELKYMIYIDQLDIDVITQYLYKMLYFFKSAKADLTDFNIVYYISDRTENLLKIMDRMYFIWSTVWIKDGFRDLFERIESGCHSLEIYDRDFIFHFILESVYDLWKKYIFIADGWELNALNFWEPKLSTEEEPFNIDTLVEPGRNWVIHHITGTGIPDEIYTYPRRVRPYQIAVKETDDGYIEQTIYCIPWKYKRKLIDGIWTPFVKSLMKATLILDDRSSEFSHPIETIYDRPTISAFERLDIFDKIIHHKVEGPTFNDGIFFTDMLVKTDDSSWKPLIDHNTAQITEIDIGATTISSKFVFKPGMVITKVTFVPTAKYNDEASISIKLGDTNILSDDTFEPYDMDSGYESYKITEVIEHSKATIYINNATQGNGKVQIEYFIK